MRQIRLKTHEGIKIFIFQHGRIFQYWFSHKGEMFMQWGAHNPKWWRWILPLFGKPLYEEGDLNEQADAYESHAVRSIDNLFDPTSEHCPHDVKIGGEDPALCSACSSSK